MDKQDIIEAVKIALRESIEGIASEVQLRQGIADLEAALRELLFEYDGCHDCKNESGPYQSEGAKRACEIARAVLLQHARAA